MQYGNPIVAELSYNVAIITAIVLYYTVTGLAAMGYCNQLTYLIPVYMHDTHYKAN